MRKAKIIRKTNEVDIQGELNIDGQGIYDIVTGIPALDHLLSLFSFHGLFDLSLKAAGDLEHHIIEDLGIALGKSFKDALGDKESINRYGCFTVVMDKVAVESAVDISGRPSLHGWTIDKSCNGLESFTAADTFDNTDFTAHHAKEFIDSFLRHSGISLVYIIKSSEGDLHHILEALFKAMGKAINEAAQINPRRKGIPSTKGVID